MQDISLGVAMGSATQISMFVVRKIYKKLQLVENNKGSIDKYRQYFVLFSLFC
jgi:hypothetical protein